MTGLSRCFAGQRSVLGSQGADHLCVADLACGHRRHVRHQPPFHSRPWVLTEEGRRTRLGATLNCLDCEAAG